MLVISKISVIIVIGGKNGTNNLKGACKVIIEFKDNLKLELNKNGKVTSPNFKGWLVRDFRIGEKALFVSPKDESFRYPFKVRSVQNDKA